MNQTSYVSCAGAYPSKLNFNQFFFVIVEHFPGRSRYWRRVIVHFNELRQTYLGNCFDSPYNTSTGKTTACIIRAWWRIYTLESSEWVARSVWLCRRSSTYCTVEQKMQDFWQVLVALKIILIGTSNLDSQERAALLSLQHVSAAATCCSTLVL